MIQLVLIQSFDDEFEMPEGHHLGTQAVTGSIFMKGNSMCKLTSKRLTKYCFGKVSLYS